MYNLDFVKARQELTTWQQTHPQDPLGPVSQASSYLFEELDRLGALETQLFVNDERFETRQKHIPNSENKILFDAAISHALELADRELITNPMSANAMLSKALAFGLKADYAALVEKRNIQSLAYIKLGRQWAQRALAADPTCYDAHLALGVENYLLGTKPLIARAFLRLGGAQIDKEKGIQELQLTADKGRLLQPFARVLLAVAALREGDVPKARQLLQELRDEFPGNPLYGRELAKLESNP